MPAARFHAYSDTRELELSDRTWRCRWCHAKAKDLRTECTKYKSHLKKTFHFKKPTARAVRRAQGRRLWGRKKLAVSPHADHDNEDQELY